MHPLWERGIGYHHCSWQTYAVHIMYDQARFHSPSPPAFPDVTVKLTGPEQGDGHTPQEWNDNQATREPGTRVLQPPVPGQESELTLEAYHRPVKAK